MHLTLLAVTRKGFCSFAGEKHENRACTKKNSQTSMSADKAKPGLHSCSWLCYIMKCFNLFNLELKLGSKQEANMQWSGVLACNPKNVALCGFICHHIFGRLVTGRSGDV